MKRPKLEEKPSPASAASRAARGDSKGDSSGSGGGSLLKILLVIGVLVGLCSVAFFTGQLPQSKTQEPVPSDPTPERAQSQESPASHRQPDKRDIHEPPVETKSEDQKQNVQQTEARTEPSDAEVVAPPVQEEEPSQATETDKYHEPSAPPTVSTTFAPTETPVTDSATADDSNDERSVPDSHAESPATEQPQESVESQNEEPADDLPRHDSQQQEAEQPVQHAEQSLEKQEAQSDAAQADDDVPVQQDTQQQTQPDHQEAQASDEKDDSESQPEELSPENKRMEAAIKEISEKANLTCDEWMEKARKLMNEGEASFPAALDTLAMCVYQEPNNSAAMWNMAVLLVKMKRNAEALVQMENAIAADPQNKEYRRGAGALLFNMGAHIQAIKALETYLELNLYTESWTKMMEDIYWQREDELSFFREADEYDTMVLSMSKLLRCYLELRHLRKADRIYQILITLQQHDHDMMENYATFAFGLGNLWNGVRFMKIYMEHQFYHSKMGTMEEAYEVMTAHMLRLATSGFDAHVVNLARSLFLAGTNAAEMIREGCGADLLLGFSADTHTLRQSELVDILGACVIDQQLIPTLLQAGASKVANNIFGWSSLLHGINLGHLQTFDVMVSEGMDAAHRTLLGMTALHVAALRGRTNLLPSILKAGVKSSEVDEYGRSPSLYACELRYAAADFHEALNVPLPPDCPSPVSKTGSSPFQSAAGEWLDTYKPLPEALLRDSCDIDSVPSDTSAADFFRDYLSLQKPVIIRHGLTNWATLKKKLQRQALDREFGALKFKRATVPYADTFGLEHKVTTLHDYLGYLSLLEEDEKTGTAPEKADYIFSSLSADHPLRSLFAIPAALDPNTTHISTQSVQFYVGPSLTGAPPHFHNFAWNGLVYGAKRWFITPPQRSIYSKQPVLDWYKTYRAGSAFECTQHAGDVLFVPAMWGHAVINLKETVGFASEFIYGASEFSL